MRVRSSPNALEKVPQFHLEELKGWNTLISHDQQVVKRETQLLFESIQDVGKGRLKIGEHLTRVRDILEPRRMFVKYLKTLRFSQATAYRFIDTYNAAKTILPSPVMHVALMKGTDSINPRLVKAFPPPKSTDVAVISNYIDKISQKARGKKEDDSEDQLAETLKRECLNFIRTRWQRLPESMSKRDKNAWMNDLRGMTLTLQGISNQMTIEASAIPAGYVRPRGRPSNKSKAG